MNKKEKPVKIRTMLVKCDSELKEKKKVSCLKDHIIDEFSNIEIDKNDPNLIRYILEKIENEVNEKKCDDKQRRNMFFDIYSAVCKIKLSDEEKKNINKVIDFINKEKLVRKISFTKVIYYYLKKKLM